MEKEKNCSNCKHTNKAEDEFPCSVCIRNYIDKYEPITNYDRIKSMSVEEMAEFNVTHDAENNMYLSLNGFLYGEKEVAIQKNIEWLLQEVKAYEKTER